jgi:hypothetical protein
MKTSRFAINLLIILSLGCSSKPSDNTEDVDEDAPMAPSFSRMFLIGDYDGDERIDTLFESYISGVTGKEITDITDGNSVEEEKPIDRFYYSHPGIDTFLITNEPRQKGILMLVNLGNVNGKPGEEVGYIVDWLDESNINAYHIVTLNGKRWEEIVQFPINEMLSFEPGNVFENQSLVIADSTGFKYKFYSDSATVETGKWYP